MSKLSSARDQLKRQMLRVELITKVVEFADSLPTSPPDDAEDFYQEVAEQVSKLFSDYAEQAIDPRPMRRKPDPVPEETPNEFDEENLKQTQKPPNPAPTQHDQIADRVKFMQQYRPLADRVVTGKTKDGVEITGRLTSIDFPYLVVKDEQKGMKFQVDPETVKPTGGR